MHAPHPQNPGLLKVASQAEQMARNSQQESIAFAFQTVAMVSMAIMGLTSAAHLIRDMLRKDRSRGRD
jgi:hypothetical protein